MNSLKLILKNFVNNELEHDKWNIAEINYNATEWAEEISYLRYAPFSQALPYYPEIETLNRYSTTYCCKCMLCVTHILNGLILGMDCLSISRIPID